MTQQEAIRWLSTNNAKLSFETINGYNFFRVAVKDRVFRISIFLQDEMQCSFIPAVTFFNS